VIIEFHYKGHLVWSYEPLETSPDTTITVNVEGRMQVKIE